MKTNAVVFDLDGTLANINHRRHFVRGGKKNWPAFEKAIPNDTLNLSVAILLEKLQKEYAIIIASGRSEDSRVATAEWLKKNGINYDELFMRASKDYRSDVIVKQEMYDNLIKPHYHVMFVFDDRPGVVDMWRANGLWVFDCNQTREDF